MKISTNQELTVKKTLVGSQSTAVSLLHCLVLLQASTFPTVVVYVMDTSRSVSPVTFMSNMTYACSILYKTKLPFIVAMNKVRIFSWSFYPEKSEKNVSVYNDYGIVGFCI